MRSTLVRSVPVLLGSAGISLIVVGLCLFYLIIPYVTDSQLRKGMVLEEGSLFYENWRARKRVTFKAYLYNVTNPEEILNGATPIMKEVGPYVFSQWIGKDEVQILDNDTIEYRQTYRTMFEPELSGKLRETDVVSIYDLPFLGAVFAISENSFGQMERLVPVIQGIFANRTSPLLTASVQDILFRGIEMDCSAREVMAFFICRQMARGPSHMYYHMDENRVFKYSLLRERNTTETDVYTCYRGFGDIRQRGAIKSINNASLLPYWGTPYCNMVNGTNDGAFYPVYSNKSEPVYFYESLLRRSVRGDFVRETDVNGIKSLRFEQTENYFESPSVNPDNQCYCPAPIFNSNASTCPPRGFISLARVIMSPVYVSAARYLFTDVNISTFGEVEPRDFSDLVTFVEIEPMLGLVVRAAKRVHLSVQMRKVPALSYLRDVAEILVPSVYIELLYEASDDDKHMIRGILHILDLGNIISHTFVAVGMVLTFSAIFLAFYFHAKMEPNSKIKSSPDENVMGPAVNKEMRDLSAYNLNHGYSPHKVSQPTSNH